MRILELIEVAQQIVDAVEGYDSGREESVTIRTHGREWTLSEKKPAPEIVPAPRTSAGPTKGEDNAVDQ